jgi:protein CpxP
VDQAGYRNLKDMRKLFLTFAIAVFGLTAGYAQTAAHHEKATPVQKAEKSTDKLQKQLSLSADQKKKVYAIELDKFQKAELLHKSSHDTKTAYRDKQKALKKETDAKLDHVLNPEQKKKLDAIHAAKKAKKDQKKSAQA